MENTLTMINLIVAVISAVGGAVLAIATMRSKIKKEQSEAIEKVIQAKTSLMEFTAIMDNRMAGYVEQLQMTRQKMLEMEERHVQELRNERNKTEEALAEIVRLQAEWEQHKKDCPIFSNKKK